MQPYRSAMLYLLLTVATAIGLLIFLSPESTYSHWIEILVTENFSSSQEAQAEDLAETSEVKTEPIQDLAAPQPNEVQAPAPTTLTSAPTTLNFQDDLPRDNPEGDMINRIPLEYADQAISPAEIIDDKLNLLPEDFKVPEGLKKRVAFWMNIYAKYTSHFSIIHDARQPWIIYRVVDLRSIYDGPQNRFVKDANDHKAVYKARFEVRSTLLRLAKKKNFKNLTSEEYEFYKLLEDRPGARRKVFLQAARDIHSQRGQKDFYRNGLISSSLYLNEMENIFAHYDLPVELTRLPLVESSFNLDATSKVGASGVWQFMTNMGKKYLTVGKAVDERNSPIKATEAAAKLMLSNFRVTHSWPLAVTAYNHGAGGVEKGCKKLHTTSISDLVNKYQSRSFSFASQNFYSEFLAALYGEKYQDKIFGTVPKYAPIEAEASDLKYSMRAKTLVNIVGMTIEELKLFNPDLKSQAIAGSTFLPVGYHIRLPIGRKNRLELFNQEAADARSYVTKAAKHHGVRI